jgi:hypothetical protein
MAYSHELLGRVDWGCKGGDHTGWVVVEAQDERTAKMFLPTSIRQEAHAVLLNKFTIEDVTSFHEKEAHH